MGIASCLIWLFMEEQFFNGNRNTLWLLPNETYNVKINQLYNLLKPYTAGTGPWMSAIYEIWFSIKPHQWQVNNALHLCQNQDVFITSRTGSGKSMLTLVLVIAQRLLGRLHVAITVYPTCELMAFR